jgi:BCD family chlorophyll transporter-like MFS transporter
MQDVLLEPYGGQVLRLTVAETTALTALLAAGDARRLRACGAPAHARRRPVPSRRARRPRRGRRFSAVIFAAPLDSPTLFRAGAILIGYGGGLFSVGTLTAAMALARDGQSGLALGAWGPSRPPRPGSRSRSAARSATASRGLPSAGCSAPR